MYKRIWADCINRIKLNGGRQNKWMLDSVLIMSFLMSLNLFVILVVFQKSINNFFYEINFAIFSGFINYILTLVFLYYIPIFIINYLFINKNIDKLIKIIDDGHLNGNFILRYSLFSIFSPIVLFWIFWFL